MMLILISILTVIFFITTIFLGKEFLKKFSFMKNFVQSSNQMVVWKYSGDKKPGMHNIVLRGKTPFCALIGFELGIPMLKYSGFDYFGFVKSGKNNIAVLSTYLGKNHCEFQFFLNTDITNNPIKITSNEEDQLLHPNSKSKPHWYQRIGFYG